MKWKIISGTGIIAIAILSFVFFNDYEVTEDSYYCQNEPDKILECNSLSRINKVGIQTRCYIISTKKSWDNCATGWIKVLDYIEEDNTQYIQLEKSCPNSFYCSWKTIKISHEGTERLVYDKGFKIKGGDIKEIKVRKVDEDLKELSIVKEDKTFLDKTLYDSVDIKNITIDYILKNCQKEICKFLDNSSFVVVFDSSSGLVGSGSDVWSNRTESSTLGARLLASTFYANFDVNGSINNTGENSIYNNKYQLGAGVTPTTFPTWGASCGYGGTGCLDFDGGDHLRWYSNWAPGGRSITVSMWLNPDSITSFDSLFSSGSGTDNDLWMMLDRGKLEVWHGNAAVLANSDITLSIGTWGHITMVYDYNLRNITFYLNGIKQGCTSGSGCTGAWARSSDTNFEYFGVDPRNFGQYFYDGQLDDLMVWSGTALSDNTILDVYNNQSGKYLKDGSYRSFVFYNKSSTYWNTTLSIADSNGDFILSGGSPSPNINGNYIFNKTSFNGEKAYVRDDGAYWVYFYDPGVLNSYSISTNLGDNPPLFLHVSSLTLEGEYQGFVGGTGSSYGQYDGINLSYDNLISYWSLDNYYNDDIFSDVLQINNGTPTGTNNATGISSGAVWFDGVSDYINIDDVDSLDYDGSQNLSYSAWFYAHDVSGVQTIFDKWGNIDSEDVNEREYIIYSNGATLNYVVLNDFTNDIDAIPISAGQWYHIVVTMDDSKNIEMFLNQISMGSNTASTSITLDAGNDLRFGQNSATNWFNGNIDEVLVYNKTLVQSEIESLYKAGLSQHANTNVTLETRTATNYNISDSGLTGLWGFNGNANDELGLHNGTLSGAPVSNEGNGTVGKGYWFDGSDDYIQIDGQTFMNGYTELTMSAWVKVDSLENYQGYVFSYDAVYDFFGLRQHSGSNIRFDVGDGSEYQVAVTANSPTVLGEWMHVAGTWANGEVVKLYINGEWNADSAGALTGSLSQDDYLKIAMNDQTGAEMKGAVDEVRVYNRKLSDAEIKNLYEMGNYHIEWNEWDDEGKAIDLIPTTSTNEGKFFQYKAILNTESLNVSPYVLNHIIKMTSGLPPIPPDIEPPLIILKHPRQDALSIDNYTTFVYQVNETSDIVLFVNGVQNGTTTSVTINTDLFFYRYFKEGIKEWTINATDSNSNVGTKSRNFTVDENPWEINGTLGRSNDGTFVVRGCT